MATKQAKSGKRQNSQNPFAGYEAVVPSSTDALKAIQSLTHLEQRYLDMISQSGSRGMTRHEVVAEAVRVHGKNNLTSWQTVTGRLSTLRMSGWVRHKVMKDVTGKRVLVRRKDLSGRMNTVLVAVAHFDTVFADTRFAALLDAYADAMTRHQRFLKAATAAKQEALELLHRVHQKLRKIHE